MAQQSTQRKASVTWLSPQPELDTAPCDYQPPGVDEEKEKEPEGSPSY